MAKRNFNDLLAAMPPERVANIEAGARAELKKMRLRELRRAMQLTQEQVAETMEITQGSLSKIERQTDMHISTLRRFLESAGARLEIAATFPDGEKIVIDQFENAEQDPDKKDWSTEGLASAPGVE